MGVQAIDPLPNSYGKVGASAPKPFPYIVGREVIVWARQKQDEIMSRSLHKLRVAKCKILPRWPGNKKSLTKMSEVLLGLRSGIKNSVFYGFSVLLLGRVSAKSGPRGVPLQDFWQAHRQPIGLLEQTLQDTS
jgi:hypothetical protein